MEELEFIELMTNKSKRKGFSFIYFDILYFILFALNNLISAEDEFFACFKKH